MPGNLLSIDTMFPSQTGDTKKDVETIRNYLYMLLEQLRYTLSNLDTSNWNETSLTDFIEEIRAGVVTAETVISNVVITNTLAADNATIAELTVDRLDTSTKVQKYLSSDTSDVNYIRIQNQVIQLVTASTTGASSAQAEDRNGNPMYWTDETHAAATTDETDYPVYIYTYTEAIKLQISFDEIGGVYVPRITLGAGEGESNNEKAFIYKATDGLYIDYQTTDGATMRVKLDDQCILATGIDFCQAAKNAAAVEVTTSEVTAAEKTVDIDVRSRLVVMFSAEVTISGGAAEVTAKTYIDSTAQTYQPTLYCASEKPYVLTYLDAKEGVASGSHTVEVDLVTDANAAGISIGHAVLVVQAFASPLPTFYDATGFTATADATDIDLAWTNPTAETFTEVEVYRYSSSLASYDRAWCASNATLVYSGTGTSYSDTGLDAETEYFYKIFAAYLADGSDYYSAGVIASATTGESVEPTYTYLFTGNASGVPVVYKYSISDMSYIAQSAGFSGPIYGLSVDSSQEYVYATDGSGAIKKIRISDMSVVSTNTDYSAALWENVIFGNYIYSAGGGTNQKIYKYDLATLTKQAESNVAYGGTVHTIATAGTDVFIGGYAVNKIYKYDLETLTKEAESLSYGGAIRKIISYNGFLYVGGNTTKKVYKYDPSTLTKQAESESYGGTIWAIATDGTYLYVGGETTKKVYKYDLSTLTKQAESFSFTDTIYDIACSGGFIYVGQNGTNASKLDCETLTIQASTTNGITGVQSVALG